MHKIHVLILTMLLQADYNVWTSFGFSHMLFIDYIAIDGALVQKKT